VLLAAAQQPRAVWSLTAIEPLASSAARGDPDLDTYEQAMLDLHAAPPADPSDFLRAYFRLIEPEAVLPAELPPHLLGLAAHLQHNFRPPWEAEIPTDPLMLATFPKLFITGGHNPAYEAIGDALALQLGGDRKLIPGAGHTPQFIADHFNAVLDAFLQAHTLP
jgi:hypothetical protein